MVVLNGDLTVGGIDKHGFKLKSVKRDRWKVVLTSISCPIQA